MKFTITPIGSCRIVDPLRRARSGYGFELSRNRSFGFTHTSPEAVQQLKFMRGELDIPEALWPYVSNNDRAEVLAQAPKSGDIHVVELSSEKILSMNGVYLQLNYLRTQFVPFFADGKRKNAYWKAIEKGTQEDIDALLAEHWSETDEQKADCAVLRNIRLRRADEEQTRADIRYLKEALPFVVFVTHVNAIDSGGTVIKTRDRYIQMVKRIAGEEGCLVIDPTDMMQHMGQQEALEPDLNHYTDDFKERVVENWFDAALTQALTQMIQSRDDNTAQAMLEAHLKARKARGDTAKNAGMAQLAAAFPDLGALSPVS